MSFMSECKSRDKPMVCSVIVSKTKEEMTTKPKNNISVNAFRKFSGWAIEWTKSNQI